MREPYTPAVTAPIPLDGALLGLDALLGLLPLPAMLVANVAVMREGGAASPSRVVRIAWAASWGLLVVIGISALAYGALGFASPGLLPFALLACAAGVVSIVCVWRPFRVAVARALPIDADDPVHALAISLTVLLVATQLGNQLSQNVLQQVSRGSQLQPLDLIVQDIPFVLAAVVGVGLFIRRGVRATLDRLGMVRPTVWQVCLGLSAAGLFYVVSLGADDLASRLTPDLSQQVNSATEHLFGQLNNPIGIATIALTAGIAEELLFRGALQPRLGIPWVAVVFALTHSQYGLSVSVVAVFVLALGLGLIRRYANTTTSMICHIAYNTVVGITIAGPLIPPAIAIEAALLALTVTTFILTRRRPT